MKQTFIKRILVLIHEYPPVGGGGGKVARDVCEALAGRGHHIDLLTCNHNSLPGDIRTDGLRIIRLNCQRRELYRASLESMFLFVARSTLTAIGLARRNRYDLIHAHFAVPAGAAAWLISKATKTPYVITSHLGDVPGGTPEKTDAWFRWVYPFTGPIWRDAACVTAVSEHTRQLAARHYPVPIEVIPNGIERRIPLDEPVELHQPPMILFSARFMPQKNPLQVVQILGGLKDLPWQAAMLGDGPLRSEVEDELRLEGLDKRVTLTGWIPPEAVLDWLMRGDILLLPSQAEGLSMTGLQAKANGLALVASRTSGNLELVHTPDEGYLVTPDDTAGYITALRHLLTNPTQLRVMRQKSLASAVRYDLQAVVDRYEEVFMRVSGLEN